MLVFYLDAAEDRIKETFTRDVEVARSGFIFAHDATEYRRWRRVQPRSHRTGLSGHALEQAVMAFAMVNPDLVKYQGA